ncbi:hypothetical protein KY495_08680 [Massilia sp. PAMC28688]|uniref:hypothetical protein n=1 Tax=Massilia sp. PAMC28688 TaxID=2861283 RepID=UPI001C62A79D|nr:hypothetical protein [Massilia sp. PAMC28688]QYF95212.1 hypothetical protein KY495_08680 [Massilia sp. PAMC28688]
MKSILYAFFALIVTTFAFFGGLWLWAGTFVEHGDSYWDRTAGAADTFFGCWIAISLIAAIVGGWLGRKHDRRRA